MRTSTPGQLKAYKIGPAHTARVRIKASDLDDLLIPYTPGKDDGKNDEDGDGP